MLKDALHRRIGPALLEPSTWLAIAAAFGTLATQIPAPLSYGAFAVAAFGTIAGALLKEGNGQ